MNSKIRFVLVILISNVAIGIALPNHAQIVPDNTLATPSTTFNQGNLVIIDGGNTVQNNLFHSFKDFSVPGGTAALFNNTTTIQNIISRVTGGSVSNINGLIQANGNANLFFLNPSGVVFGPGSFINIGGSLVVSSANSLGFRDGVEFLTNSTSSTLTGAKPSSLNFSGNPGMIRVEGMGNSLDLNSIFFPFINAGRSPGIRVNPAKSISLIGGQIELESGALTALSGRIDIGSVEQGRVDIVQNLPFPVLSYSNVSAFQDISLTNKSLLDASGFGNGSINIQGRNIDINSGSLALIQNVGSIPNGPISVNASEALSISGTSTDGLIPSSLVNETLTQGASGDILVSSSQFSLNNGAAIAARTFSIANGGEIVIQSNEAVVDGFSAINPLAFTAIATQTVSPGNAGNIFFKSNSLNVTNGANIGSIAFSTGNSGNVQIDADDISVIGLSPTTIRSTIFSNTAGEGDAGNLLINTKRLSVLDGGVISSTTAAFGDAGSIEINATDFVLVSGNSPFPNQPLNVSTIFSASVLETPFFQTIFQLPPIATGNAGEVTINTGKFSVLEGARVTASTAGPGNAGNVLVNATESIIVSGSNGISIPSNISARTIGSGRAGSLILNSPKITISDRGVLLVSSQDQAFFPPATGDTGTLAINITDKSGSLTLDNGSINAIASRSSGGDVQIDTPLLLLRNNSQITASAFNAGGNITLDSDLVALFDLSSIEANSNQSTGGNITINTQGIFLSFNSQITASSLLGPQFSGTIEVNSPNIDFTKATLDLAIRPEVERVTTSCNIGPGGAASEFTRPGSGGIASNSDSSEEVSVATNSQANLQAQQEYYLDPETGKPEIYPNVVGWKNNPDGTIAFTSDPTEAVQTKAFCSKTASKES